MRVPVMQFSLGAFGPRLAEQGLEGYLDARDIEHFDRDDEAISRLHMRGIIPYSVHIKAREKLAKSVRMAADRHSARALSNQDKPQ